MNRMMMSFLLVGLGLTAPLLRAEEAGKDWGVERRYYLDPVTQVRICELTREPAVTGHEVRECGAKVRERGKFCLPLAVWAVMGVEMGL